MNQNCRVCGELAAGYHFGAFTCEGCKSFFGRTYNNQSSIGECKNGDSCVINKKNRTSCKSCRLKKCFAVGMSKSGSRYGRRSNWFKIHCLLQDHPDQTRHPNHHHSSAADDIVNMHEHSLDGHARPVVSHGGRLADDGAIEGPHPRDNHNHNMSHDSPLRLRHNNQTQPGGGLRDSPSSGGAPRTPIRGGALEHRLRAESDERAPDDGAPSAPNPFELRIQMQQQLQQLQQQQGPLAAAAAAAAAHEQLAQLRPFAGAQFGNASALGQLRGLAELQQRQQLEQQLHHHLQQLQPQPQSQFQPQQLQQHLNMNNNQNPQAMPHQQLLALTLWLCLNGGATAAGAPAGPAQ